MGDKAKNSKDKSNIQWDIASLNASSAKDMTGLIPRGPESEEELESYNEILTYRPEKIVAEGNEKNLKKTLDVRKKTYSKNKKT